HTQRNKTALSFLENVKRQSAQTVLWQETTSSITATCVYNRDTEKIFSTVKDRVLTILLVCGFSSPCI
ncbi:hypothetical protein ACQP3J_32185, partial [Escherichia coli]